MEWYGAYRLAHSVTTTPWPRRRRYGNQRRDKKHAVEILSGNEAIARGAWEAGVKLAAAYPGTPSTEILEELAEYKDVYSEWSPNEKVAMEVGIGASMAGGRALVCMKHVGLNVAADPFFSASYIGVEAGLVVVSADDPGMHSSQDEQDNRNYAKFARVPLLEPSDSGEAKDFMVAAFELSERFDTPVLFRTTTRTSHSKSLVTFGERDRDRAGRQAQPQLQQVRHDARQRHRPARHRRAAGLRPGRVRRGLPVQPHRDGRSHDRASSPPASAYGYTREALPGRQLPEAGHDLSAAQEDDRRVPLQGGQALRRRGARSLPRGSHPADGHQDRRRQGAEHACWARSAPDRWPNRWPRPASPESTPTCWWTCAPRAEGLPSRPPTLCPGCSHRGVFTVLKKLRVFVSGDIGCYTLGALEPFNSVHASTCMGASISMAHGMAKVQEPAAPAAGAVPTTATRWSPSSATPPSTTRASPPSWTWSTTTATRSPSSSTTAPRP